MWILFKCSLFLNLRNKKKVHQCVPDKTGAVKATSETSYIQPDSLDYSLDDTPNGSLQTPAGTGCRGWPSAARSTRSCGSRASGSWGM